MLLLGIDIETGLDASSKQEVNFITEVGAVLWDTELNAPIVIYDELVDDNCVTPISEGGELYSGISEYSRKKYGKNPTVVIPPLLELLGKADYLVAHNGRVFDKPLLHHFFKRNSFEFPKKYWIDTLFDVSYPKNCASKNLTYLAAFYGFVNPFPHRAFSDVLTMFRVLKENGVSYGQLMDKAKQDRYLVQAEVTIKDKDKAKSKNFSWNGQMWSCELTKDDLDKILPTCDFKVTILEKREALS